MKNIKELSSDQMAQINGGGTTFGYDVGTLLRAAFSYGYGSVTVIAVWAAQQ